MAITFVISGYFDSVNMTHIQSFTFGEGTDSWDINQKTQEIIKITWKLSTNWNQIGNSNHPGVYSSWVFIQRCLNYREILLQWVFIKGRSLIQDNICQIASEMSNSLVDCMQYLRFHIPYFTYHTYFNCWYQLKKIHWTLKKFSKVSFNCRSWTFFLHYCYSYVFRKLYFVCNNFDFLKIFLLQSIMVFSS